MKTDFFEVKFGVALHFFSRFFSKKHICGYFNSTEPEEKIL
jgi:hypothetical protein